MRTLQNRNRRAFPWKAQRYDNQRQQRQKAQHLLRLPAQVRQRQAEDAGITITPL